MHRDTILRETFAPVAAAARCWSVRGVNALRFLTAADGRDLRTGAVVALTEAAPCWDVAGRKRDAEACRGLLWKLGSGEWKDWVGLTVAEQWLLRPRSRERESGVRIAHPAVYSFRNPDHPADHQLRTMSVHLLDLEGRAFVSPGIRI